MLLFAAALFLGSGLLFVVEPMAARRILPLLGGTPAVWTTCMLFYQAVVLAGYAYAHGLTAGGARRNALALHSVVLLLPFAPLAAGLPEWRPPAGSNPVPWVLLLLASSVGPALFAVSTTAPLLQKWFAATRHPRARDPYFLYGASNLGSLIGLLGYPLLLEPTWA